jgi:hydroxymethylbilane synthase
MHLRAMVATPDGTRSARAELSGPADAPAQLGEQVSELLRRQDAEAILAVCRQDAAPDA